MTSIEENTMSGYLPPGCTQRECDEAQGGYWDEPAAEDEGGEPPPCERGYPLGQQHLHPRFPSGDCVICGALCTEGCKHELAIGEWAPREP